MNLLSGAPGRESAVRRLRDVSEQPLRTPAFVEDAWELARSRMEVDAETEARALAVLDHPEFFPLYAREDEIPDQFEVGGVNPRVHVRLHELVEIQLIQNDPPGAALAVARLLGQDVDRHRALHLLMDGLIPELHTVLREGRPADMDRYGRHLTQLSLARVAGVPARRSQAVRPKQHDGPRGTSAAGSGRAV